MKVDKRYFEKIVKEALLEMGDKVLKKLENVEIVIDKKPTLWQLKNLKNQKNTLILGLYEGIPKIKRYNCVGTLPDKITIFKDSIEKMANNESELKKIIKKTIWHEIGHYFGLNEKEVRELEKKKFN